MNRFFRSALFPLVVIVLLVFLASETLIPRRGNDTKMTYSELIQQAKSGGVEDVLFAPTRQQITATLTGGDADQHWKKWTKQEEDKRFGINDRSEIAAGDDEGVSSTPSVSVA